MCKENTLGSASCARCRQRNSLPKQVWVASLYYSYAKILVERLKFARNKEAARVVAKIMYERLPFLPQNTIITHVPTAPNRIRSRGYDHAQLVAKQLASQTDRQYRPLLRRVSNTRQVGASRPDRLKQLSHSFCARPARDSDKQKPILLIDDVITTGGTLLATTKELRRNGYKTILASTFAQKD